MSQALYRKWRPARFDDVIGQEHVTQTLRNGVASGRVGHAYLFCGPRGTGKTTSARLLAKAVNCLDDDPTQRPCNKCRICLAINDGRFLDLIEIDAASNTGVDDIRDLRDKINFAPSDGKFKVYIIDEVHMLSTAAFNALLKTLEEPPAHAKFVLATTEEHKVPMTIKSRCQQFNFRLLTLQEIMSRLRWLTDKEGLTVEPEALSLVARHGAGSLRDAESLLDQLVTAPGDTITLERAQMVLGTASLSAIRELTEAWLSGNAPAGLTLIHQALSSGADARQFCRQMVDYLRQVLLLKAAGASLALDVPDEQKEIMIGQAERSGRDNLITAIKSFNTAALTPANSWQPQLPLELAFIDILPDEPSAIRDQRLEARDRQPTVKNQRETVNEKPATPVTSHQSPATGHQPPVNEEPATPKASKPKPETREPKPEPSHQPPATSHQPPTTSHQPPATKLSLDQFKTHWPEMVKLAKQRDRNLPALLAMCQPLAVERDTLVLGFEFPLLKKRLDDKPELQTIVAEMFSQLLGSHCKVRSVVTKDYQAEPADSSFNKEEVYALADELDGQVREI